MNAARLLDQIAAALEQQRNTGGLPPSEAIRFSDLTFALTKLAREVEDLPVCETCGKPIDHDAQILIDDHLLCLDCGTEPIEGHVRRVRSLRGHMRELLETLKPFLEECENWTIAAGSNREATVSVQVTAGDCADLLAVVERIKP